MKTSGLYRALRGLMGPRFRSREELESYQSACLRRLVDHAYQQVPYYRRRFDEAGVSTGQIRGIEDLGRLPTTERADIQLLPAEDVCAVGLAHRINRITRSSGSSGSPLAVRRTAAEERVLLAFRARAVAAWGFGPRARRVKIDHINATALAAEAPKWYEKFGIKPRLILDWRMPREETVAGVARFQPHLISGPPSLLAELADELTDSDRARIPASRILTGGEVLSASARERIERGFGCPVSDVYGCTEIVFISMEAPGEEGHRLCEESLIVEVLDNGVPSRRGEIFLTGLHQLSMPFIRYRLGDYVEVMDGAGPHRLLRSIDGRVTDRFLLPDGRRLHGYSLGELVETSGLPVRKFQITQIRRDVFRIRLVLEAAGQESLAALDEKLRHILGPGVQVRLKVVDSLDRPHRKFYPYVSCERLNELRGSDIPG